MDHWQLTKNKYAIGQNKSPTFADGDRIILLADMNDDISGSTIQEFCKNIHLVEAIHYLHGWALVPMHQ